MFDLCACLSFWFVYRDIDIYKMYFFSMYKFIIMKYKKLNLDYLVNKIV
jgi:hypothetical protein